MNGGDDGHIGAEAAVITDGDSGIILHGEVEIDEYIIAYGGMAAVMEGNGALQEGALTDGTQQIL